MSKSIGGQFVPMLHSTLDSPAWKAMSPGARCLYVALKRHVPRQRNRAFLSYRKGADDIGTGKTQVSVWFAELQHYGFVVLLQRGARAAATALRIHLRK